MVWCICLPAGGHEGLTGLSGYLPLSPSLPLFLPPCVCVCMCSFIMIMAFYRDRS